MHTIAGSRTFWCVAAVVGLTLTALSGGATRAGDWPQFRGPNGLAVTPDLPAVLKFDGKTGDNVLWSVELDEAGRSSPVVVGDKLFLTGGTAQKQWVYCYRVADGAVLWKRQVEPPKVEPAKDPVPPDEEPPANPAGDSDENVAVNTPAADGERVYVVFGTGDVAAFDHDGRQVWAVSLRPIVSAYGYCSSPLLFKKKLIIQLDHAGKSGSAVIAFDVATGKQLWRTTRKTRDAFGSPILAETPAGPQVITSAAGAMQGYDPETGRELWKAETGGKNDAPSPAWSGGIAITAHSGDQIYAFKTDGVGDVTHKRLAWTKDRACEASSPVAKGNLVFVPHDEQLICYTVDTGRELWAVPDPDKAYASLCIAGDRLYYTARTGTGVIYRAGEKLEELARFDVGEGTDATPAFAAGKILVRGNRRLWCFGRK